MKEYHESVVQPTPQNDNAPVYKSVNLISLFVGMIVMGAFIYDNHSVTVSVLAGVSFYGAVAGALILAPHATQIVIAHMREVTTRRFNELPYKHAQQATQRVSLLDPIQLPYAAPTQPLALPQGSTFVPAQAEPDDSAKREAAAWVLQLYQANGEPDPKKVLLISDKERPGRVRIAAPSRPAKQYLLDKHIIHDLGNGFRLSLARCPNITAAQNHLV